MRGASRERVDGILLLDKPVGPSSNHAMIAARRLLNARKGGHGGTLDPMASGLLPLLFGEATKFAQDALDADKTYLATLALGVETDSGDAEGRVIATKPVVVDEAAVRAACAAFEGEIDQVPPMHSALKRDGKPLYEYARAGIELPREPRRVTIHRIELLETRGLGADAPSAVIRVTCSKGTYIRTLASDIGKRLGCGASLSTLRRERVGSLSVDDAISLDALDAMDVQARRRALAPVDALLGGVPRIELDAPSAQRFEQGQRLRLAPEDHPPDVHPPDTQPPDRVCVYGPQSRLLGLARWDGHLLSPLRLIAAPTQETAS